jgi:hypothetical protein
MTDERHFALQCFTLSRRCVVRVISSGIITEGLGFRQFSLRSTSILQKLIDCAHQAICMFRYLYVYFRFLRFLHHFETISQPTLYCKSLYLVLFGVVATRTHAKKRKTPQSKWRREGFDEHRTTCIDE